MRMTDEFIGNIVTNKMCIRFRLSRCNREKHGVTIAEGELPSLDINETGLVNLAMLEIRCAARDEKKKHRREKQLKAAMIHA